MASFVLVHGAWHGSWCWKRVRKALQAAGHDVFTPTLTGVADRSHLLSRDVNLDTHIQDVLNLIEWEELTDIVLCGHSYGGCVVTGVADRIPERIRSLVYLDAFVPEDGENQFQHLSEMLATRLLEGTQSVGEGWKTPPIPAAIFNVNAADREWDGSMSLSTRIPFRRIGSDPRTRGAGRLRSGDHRELMVGVTATVANDGTLWIAEERGLWSFAPGGWQVHHPLDGGANAVTAAEDGAVWAAFGEGVGRFTDRGWTTWSYAGTTSHPRRRSPQGREHGVSPTSPPRPRETCGSGGQTTG